MSMSSIVDAKHRIVDREVGDLSVDPRVQRSMKKARVQAIADDFRPEALGVITTSHRAADGLIHIVDGQHRYRAAEAAGYQGTIKTNEYQGLTLAQEAELFRLLNSTEKVGPVDQFLVACIEGRRAAVELAAILSENRWSVSASAGNGKISAIRSLERVYALPECGPWAAAAAIAVLTGAYGHIPSAVNGSLVEGLGKMLARYRSDVDLNGLKERLASAPGGPDGLLGYARGQKLSRSGNLSTQVARTVVGIYNQRRKTTKLPDWQ